MGIQRGNQIVIRAGHRFLRLHHFDGVGHPGGESVPGLLQRLIGQLEIAFRHRYLVGGRLDIEKRRAHLVIDLSAQIGQLVLALFQIGLRLRDVPSDAAAAIDIEFHRTGQGERAMGIRDGGADVAVVGGDSRDWVALGVRRFDRLLRGAHLRLGALIIRPRLLGDRRSPHRQISR